MPTWLSTTQWSCQCVSTWNTEQPDRSDWPLSVPAVSGTIRLSARCQSTLWPNAFPNSHNWILSLSVLHLYYILMPSSLSNSGTGGIQRPPLSCFAGHYCPVGTMFPTQHKCPAGTWSERSGLESESECRPCPRGWYCLAGVGVPSGRCSSGYYCPEGSMWLKNLIISLRINLMNLSTFIIFTHFNWTIQYMY